MRLKKINQEENRLKLNILNVNKKRKDKVYENHIDSPQWISCGNGQLLLSV